MSNQEKFDRLRELNLPLGQYAITGSGPLGIRNLREINDIDIIVSKKLWDRLEKKYGVTDTNSVKKIVFPIAAIEAFGEGSFYKISKVPNDPSIKTRILNAEVIEGLPFESLEHALYFKKKMNREKDRKDIKTIEKYLSDSI